MAIAKASQGHQAVLRDSPDHNDLGTLHDPPEIVHPQHGPDAEHGQGKQPVHRPAIQRGKRRRPQVGGHTADNHPNRERTRVEGQDSFEHTPVVYAGAGTSGNVQARSVLVPGVIRLGSRLQLMVLPSKLLQSLLGAFVPGDVQGDLHAADGVAVAVADGGGLDEPGPVVG